MDRSDKIPLAAILGALGAALGLALVFAPDEYDSSQRFQVPISDIAPADDPFIGPPDIAPVAPEAPGPDLPATETTTDDDAAGGDSPLEPSHSASPSPAAIVR